MQVSHRVRAKISQEGVLRRETTRKRGNSANAVQLEKSKDYRGRSMPGPCTYAFGNPAQSGGIEFHGVSERKEQSDDIRSARKFKVQVWKSPFLG